MIMQFRTTLIILGLLFCYVFCEETIANNVTTSESIKSDNDTQATELLTLDNQELDLASRAFDHFVTPGGAKSCRGAIVDIKYLRIEEEKTIPDSICYGSMCFSCSFFCIRVYCLRFERAEDGKSEEEVATDDRPKDLEYDHESMEKETVISPEEDKKLEGKELSDENPAKDILDSLKEKYDIVKHNPMTTIVEALVNKYDLTKGNPVADVMEELVEKIMDVSEGDNERIPERINNVSKYENKDIRICSTKICKKIVTSDESDEMDQHLVIDEPWMRPPIPPIPLDAKTASKANFTSFISRYDPHLISETHEHEKVPLESSTSKEKFSLITYQTNFFIVPKPVKLNDPNPNPPQHHYNSASNLNVESRNGKPSGLSNNSPRNNNRYSSGENKQSSDSYESNVHSIYSYPYPFQRRANYPKLDFNYVKSKREEQFYPLRPQGPVDNFSRSSDLQQILSNDPKRDFIFRNIRRFPRQA